MMKLNKGKAHWFEPCSYDNLQCIKQSDNQSVLSFGYDLWTSFLLDYYFLHVLKTMMMNLLSISAISFLMDQSSLDSYIRLYFMFVIYNTKKIK